MNFYSVGTIHPIVNFVNTLVYKQAYILYKNGIFAIYFDKIIARSRLGRRGLFAFGRGDTQVFADLSS